MTPAHSADPAVEAAVPRIPTGRAPRLLAFVTAAALLTACSTTGVATTPTTDPTGPTSGSSGAVEEQVGWSTTSDEPLVTIRFDDLTEGGLVGTDLTVVLPDGTLIRSTADRSGWTTATLTPAALDRLAQLVDDTDLEHPTDTGSPGITDQGTLSVELSLTTGNVTHALYAPGEDSGLTAGQQQARGVIADFISEVRGLDGDDLIAPEQPYEVERMELRAATTVRSTVASDYESAVDGGGPATFAEYVARADLPAWSGPTPLSELVANGCAVVAEGDLTALVDLLTGHDLAVALEPGASLVVATGVPSPSALTLTGVALLPHQIGCTAPWTTAAPELAEPPWPLDGSEPVTSWQKWQADETVLDLAVHDQFGHDANGASDLTWYDYSYVAGTAGGRPVIDVVAHDRSGSGYGERDPSSFAVRLDTATGEVLEFKVGR